MSLIFAEHVRWGIQYYSQHRIMSVDHIEHSAVFASILELAWERLCDEFDFPENWPNDPKAREILLSFGVIMFAEMSPDPPGMIKHVVDNWDKITKESSPEPEAKTALGRRAQRWSASMASSALKESRPYNPARYGKVRDFTDDELHTYLHQAGVKAAKALRQWREGVPIERIDA